MQRFQNFTKEQTVRLHRELWHKVAEILERNKHIRNDAFELKYQAFKELYNMEEYPLLGCWCCEYTYQRYPNKSRCEKVCPIKWSGEYCDEDGEYEHFKDLLMLGFNEKAIEMAKKIAELPEREE